MQVKAAQAFAHGHLDISCLVQDAPDPASAVGPMTLASARQSRPSPRCKRGLYQDL